MYSELYFKLKILRFRCWFLPREEKLHGLSPRANYTDRATALVGEVIAYICG
jgi:hypothetical protein